MQGGKGRERGGEREGKHSGQDVIIAVHFFFLILCQLVCFPAVMQIVQKKMDVFLDEVGSVTLCFPTRNI